MKRVSRKAEPRIVDPATHPRPFVSLTVAAAFLEIDRRALNHFIAAGRLLAYPRGRMRQVKVADLTVFKAERECPLPIGGEGSTNNGTVSTTSKPVLKS